MKRIYIISLILVLFFITGCGTVKHHNIDKTNIISVMCSEVDSLLKEGSYLIDVREKDEYDEYHLDNSINIPVGDISNIGNYINGITKESKIIVYCKSGKRSAEAASKLINIGFNNIYNLGAITNCTK